MKVEAAIDLLTPGPLETAKQDWRRDPTTWRALFKAREVNLRADHDEVADALEQHFNEMQVFQPVIRGQGMKFYSS
jgi:hypothetical protein